MTTTPRLLGHRGACAERPENTMASFERAVALGVDVLETDVHLTADGHIVISHDPDGRRSANTNAEIRRSRLSDIKRWDVGWGHVAPDGTRPFAGQGMRMPELVDLLEAFPDQALNVDIKQNDPPMVEPLLELLRRTGAAHRVTLASFHTRAIREVRARGYEGTTALSREEVLAVVFLPMWAGKRVVQGHAIQIPPRTGVFDLSTRAFIDKCHRLGLWVDYWTVNDPVQAEVLLDRGADGLISDDPGRLRAIVDRYR